MANIDHIVSAVQQSLKDEDRQAQYQGHPNPLRGHCSVATEAVYFLAGGKKSGLTPHTIRVSPEEVHWFLKDQSGKVIDPTAGQFDHPVEYEQSRGRGFPTPKHGLDDQPPSKRAQKVIERAQKFMKMNKSEEDLTKSVGTLEFPQLGITSVYSYPKSSTSPQESLSTVALANKRKPAGFESGHGFNAVDYNVNFEQGAYPQASSFAASPGKSFSGSSKKGGAYDRYLGYVEGGASIPDPSAFNAVREHEGQHSIFHEIGKRFGVKSREEVARKLFDSLDPEHQATLTTLASHSGYIPQSPFFHEEALLQPVNYLMSSEFRQKAPQIHGAVKEAWKQIREKAKMIETPTVKSEDLNKGSLQAKHPFDPTSENLEGRLETRDWQMGWAPDRSQIPHMEGEARFRALHKLHGATRARRGPTGEREFLLWRGHGPDMDVSGTHAATSDRTGWTPDASIAAGYARSGHLTGAWVPESAIVSIPKQLGQLAASPYAQPDAKGNITPKGSNEMSPEYEVVVAPSKMEIAKVIPSKVARNTPIGQLTTEHLLGKSEEDLEKNIGFLTFPKLGVHQLPTMPYTGGSPKSEMIHFGEDTGHSKGQMRYRYAVRGSTDPQERNLHGYVKSGTTMTMPRGTQVNLETHGTTAHEGQHSAFARVGQINSVAAQARLARFLHDRLNPQEQDALQKIASRSGYTKPPEGKRFKAFDYYEEAITSLQNYLQDKSFRNGVHEDLLKTPVKDDTHHGRIFQDNDPIVAKYPHLLTPRSLHDTAKGAWRKLMDVAPYVEYDRSIRDFAVKKPEMAKSEGNPIFHDKYKISHEVHGNPEDFDGYYRIVAHHPTEGEVGAMVIRIGENGWEPHVEVLPKHQRKGIGSAMWRCGESLVGEPLSAGMEATKAGQALVDKMQKMSKSEESAKKRKVVASVAVFNPEGKMLWGMRNDTGKWTMPGGHLEEGEKPLKGAIRELFEEAGLKPKDMESLGSDEVDSWDGKSKILVHAFKATCDGKPHSKNDPDKECDKWDWVDLKDDKLPEHIIGNLHSPKNVVLKLMGLQDWEDVSKAEDPLVKAIANIAPGKLIGEKRASDSRHSYDYSHLLPKHAQNGEYSIELQYTPDDPNQPHGDGMYAANLKHHGKVVGAVLGDHSKDKSTIETHSSLDEPYRGKKFGKALYTAALAHAYHVLNAKEVRGQSLSEEASHVHSSLAREHGLAYSPEHVGSTYNKKANRSENVYAHLGYTIKKENDNVLIARQSEDIKALEKVESLLKSIKDTFSTKRFTGNDSIVSDISRAQKEELDPETWKVNDYAKKAFADVNRSKEIEDAAYVSSTPSPYSGVHNTVVLGFDNDAALDKYIKNKYEPHVINSYLNSGNQAVFLASIPVKNMSHENGTPFINVNHLHDVSYRMDKRARVPFYYSVAKQHMAEGRKHPLVAPIIVQHSLSSATGQPSHSFHIEDGNGRSMSAKTAGSTHMLAYVKVDPANVPDFLKMLYETSNDPTAKVRHVKGPVHPSVPTEFHESQIPKIVKDFSKPE